MKRFLFILIALLPCAIFAQGNIRVLGEVTDFETHKPIASTQVIVNGIVVEYSDKDGRYSISVARDADVKFYHSGYDEVVVNVSNRQSIDIALPQKVVEMDAIFVQVDGKTRARKVFVEPTELEVKGQMFHIKTISKLPHELFNSRHRYIFQPKLINITRETEDFFRPIVVDGRIFQINNDRLNNGEMEGDALSRYVIEQNSGRDGEMYPYKDSLMIEPKTEGDDYRVECYLAINDLVERPSDYLDTLTIARGTKNPLRLLDYKFAPLPYMDSTRIPKPELKLMSEQGVTNIGFMLGQAKIDTRNPQNQVELDQIQEKVREVLTNEFATVRAISVAGYASPEGSLKNNTRLAEQRTNVILEEVSSAIPDEYRKYVKLNNLSKVDSWRSVADLMVADSVEGAKTVVQIVDRYNNEFASCYYAIRKLPIYRTHILPKYLPQLRRVAYGIDYTIYRKLKDPEIWERYRSGEEDISRYEYWRLTETERDTPRKIDLEEEALRRYPNFEIVANRVASRAIEADTASLEILKPCLDETAPMELIHNQCLVALLEEEYMMADSLATLLPEQENNEYLRAVVSARNGYYEEALPAFHKEHRLNEVLLLLAMERNDEALTRIREMAQDITLNTDARVWYVWAMCANRKESLGEAVMALTTTLAMDPSLEEIMRVDSDVLDVLEIVKPEEE